MGAANPAECERGSVMKEVWDKDRPKGLPKPKKLSPGKKAAAMSRAKAAGRPFPNLIDNMWASQKGKKK